MREEVFGTLGVTNMGTFVDPEKPAQVAVFMVVAGRVILVEAWS